MEQVIQINYDELLALTQVNNELIRALLYCLIFLVLLQIMRFILK